MILLSFPFYSLYIYCPHTWLTAGIQHILWNESMALLPILLRKWKQLELPNARYIYTSTCPYTIPSLITGDELIMLLSKANPLTYPLDHKPSTVSNILCLLDHFQVNISTCYKIFCWSCNLFYPSLFPYN